MTASADSAAFNDYWYNHGAEISRYALEQARYDQVHSGDAVLVFVTEKMNPALQVKADHHRPGDILVLKLNAVRKFFTGIYPYSTLTSVFAPLDVERHPLPLKISTSVQEWCGHVYWQLNQKGNSYEVNGHSYFEEEADQHFSIQQTYTEDGLWTLIRLSPDRLPLGEFKIIPGTLHVRLRHRPMSDVKAFGRLAALPERSLDGLQLMRYTVEMAEENRMLQIDFEKQFPHRIETWEERQQPMPGTGAATQITRARRTHTLMIDYWNHHGNEDRRLLGGLGLAPRELALPQSSSR